MTPQEALALWHNNSKRPEVRKILLANGLGDVVVRLDASASSAQALVEIAALKEKPIETKKPEVKVAANAVAKKF
ncbi:MAG TPA: hypothetical protein ACFYD4_09340 [Candidatus Wunengus sp. YC61]|uniref:hypothetical protein n=1 Tax=Candidatus Wunengus sp. YC61 TaxID=3367698 RepID=UPI00402875A3